MVDGVPALQMDILNQRYLSSSYAKVQFKLQKALLADNHPVGQGELFPHSGYGQTCKSALCQKRTLLASWYVSLPGAGKDVHRAYASATPSRISKD